jgi:hypothetical protein
MDCEISGAAQQHATLQESRKAPDMIDVTVCNQYRVDLTEQIAAITKQVDAWFSCIDQ